MSRAHSGRSPLAVPLATVLAALCACADDAGRTPDSERTPASELARSLVVLPDRADGAIVLEHRASGLAAHVELMGALPVEARLERGTARYPAALGPGSSFEIRTLEHGFEDTVSLGAALPAGRLTYRLTLVDVAGLRLVGDALELLDADGTPRIRMAPPFADDARGHRQRLPVRLEGCDFDDSAAPPWGRAPTPPGASSCAIVLDLSRLEQDSTYPLLVDPVWTTTSAMAAPRTGHAGITLASGRVLLVGNAEAAGMVDAEVYDPGSATFAVVGAMDEPRAQPVAASLGDGARVLVVGGERLCDPCGGLASAELFDEATGLFSTVGSMSTPRVGHAAATLVDGRVLVVGGNSGDGGAPHLATSELFELATQTFTPGPSLAQPRSFHTLTALPDGTALVVGGAPGPKLTERFDPEGFAFTPAGDLTERRVDHGALLLSDGRVLVAGGRPPGSIDAVLLAELFDPRAPAGSAWSSAGELLTPHVGAAMTLLSGDRALMVGGCCVTAAAELFDPVARHWVVTSSLLGGRSGHAIAALSETSALVAGGVGEQGPSASAEVYSLSVLGDPCQDPLGCGSGLCVDGVCCDDPCDLPCHACSAVAKGGGQSGTCEPVAADRADPRGLCSESGECGETGTCDEGGACALIEEGTPCGSDECPSQRGACTGEGTCACEPPSCAADGHSIGGVDCGPYRCREGACLSECRTSTECVDGFLCNEDGRCTSPPLPPSDLGCACRAPSSGRTSPRGWLAWAFAAWLAQRRRSR